MDDVLLVQELVQGELFLVQNRLYHAPLVPDAGTERTCYAYWTRINYSETPGTLASPDALVSALSLSRDRSPLPR